MATLRTSSIGRVLHVQSFLRTLDDITGLAEKDAKERSNNLYIRADNGRVEAYDFRGNFAGPYRTFLPLIFSSEEDPGILRYLSKDNLVYNLVYPLSASAPYSENDLTYLIWNPANVSRQAGYVSQRYRGNIYHLNSEVNSFAAAGSTTYENRVIFGRTDNEIRWYGTGGTTYRSIEKTGSQYLATRVQGNKRRVVHAYDGSLSALKFDYQYVLVRTRTAFLIVNAISRVLTDAVRLSRINGKNGEFVKIIAGVRDQQVTVTSSSKIVNTFGEEGDEIVIFPGCKVDVWVGPDPDSLTGRSGRSWQFEEKEGVAQFRKNIVVPPVPAAGSSRMYNSDDRMYNSDAMYQGAA